MDEAHYIQAELVSWMRVPNDVPPVPVVSVQSLVTAGLMNAVARVVGCRRQREPPRPNVNDRICFIVTTLLLPMPSILISLNTVRLEKKNDPVFKGRKRLFYSSENLHNKNVSNSFMTILEFILHCPIEMQIVNKKNLINYKFSRIVYYSV